MKKAEPPLGYGHLTNIIRFKRVYMTEHWEGEGTDDNPQRVIRTFFSENAEELGRIDPFKRKGML